MATKKQNVRHLLRTTKSQKQCTRIESPLAKYVMRQYCNSRVFDRLMSCDGLRRRNRYNSRDQLTCRVCSTIVKDESLWNAHITSKQHTQKVAELKAKAAKVTANRDVEFAVPAVGTKRPLDTSTTTQPHSSSTSSSTTTITTSNTTTTSSSSSSSSSGADDPPRTTLPPGFFDSTDTLQHDGQDDELDTTAQSTEVTAKQHPNLPAGFFDTSETEESQDIQQHDGELEQESDEHEPASKRARHGDEEQLEPTGAPIPKGFFDDNNKDDQARGVMKPELAYGCMY
jgi:hypothetical protein